MCVGVCVYDEVRRLGHQLGCELADALVLASHGTDTRERRQLVSVALGQIRAVASRMRSAAMISELVEAYEMAARASLRSMLHRYRATETIPSKIAA